MAFKMKAGKEGPMKKNFGDAVTPMNFNAGLKAASKAGKLDNNPKFKAAVDKAPVKLKKDGVVTGTMDKRRNLKQMVNKVKDVVKKNPEVLAIGPAGLAISKAIAKRKTKKNNDSPKKFIGAALSGAMSGMGGIAPGVTMGLGALGGLLNKRKKGKRAAAGAQAAVRRGRAPMMLKETGGDKKEQRKLKRKLNKLEREHNRDARRTEGSKLRQFLRRKKNK